MAGLVRTEVGQGGTRNPLAFRRQLVKNLGHGHHIVKDQ
jgi:hypothetical protein